MCKRLICAGVLWLFCALPLLAQTSLLDQKVKISPEATTLEAVLRELSQNYDIPFSYSNDLVPLNQKVSIEPGEQSLRELLDKLLENTDVNYKSIGKQIILQPKAAVPFPQRILNCCSSV